MSELRGFAARKSYQELGDLPTKNDQSDWRIVVDVAVAVARSASNTKQRRRHNGTITR